MRVKTALRVARTLACVTLASLSFAGQAASPQTTADGQAADLASTLQALQQRFDVKQPGYGTTDYPGHTQDHIPKSYAMILLAELDRVNLPEAAAWPDMSLAAGYWLLDNADANGDGIIGWGVPIAWDAYGDGSVNPAHTEYSISTAIVIHALLDWLERGAGAPRERILATIDAAIEPYLDPSRLTPHGLLPYSLQQVDQRYDTFNSAVYLAGQLQRFSHYASPERSARMREAADKTMGSLLAHRRQSPDGAWYWQYSIQENVANDLPHASYIVDGIDTYVRYAGKLAARFELPRVHQHLAEFIPETGPGIRGWPRFQSNIDRMARSYDIGMALSVTCAAPSMRQLSKPLLDAIALYRDGQGNYLRNPVGAKDLEAVRVNEYEAYLYRGVARCAYAEAADTGKAASKVLDARADLPAPADFSAASATSKDAPIYGIDLGQGRKAAFDLDTRQATVLFPDQTSWQLPGAGIPVALEDAGEQVRALLWRGLPTGELRLYARHGDAEPIATPIQVFKQNAQLMPRAMTWHHNTLYVVVYDNPTLHNYLLRFRMTESGAFRQEGEATQVPPLRDPAGGTYEMIPAVSFVSHQNRLYLLGGTLRAEVKVNGDMTDTRIPGCLRIVETLATPDGPAGLCLADQPGTAQYHIFGPPSVRRYPIPNDAVPWRLHLTGTDKDARLEVDLARTPADFAKLLSYDLHRIQQAGWMEFGVDNAEGRIPWSQIYYLNGFLDILQLAARDEVYRNMMANALPGIRQRLDLEISLIAQHWDEGRYKTRAFTVDRSEALFAVQSSRVLLLLHRYRTELANPVALPGYEAMRKQVLSLTDHIEVLAREGEAAHWLAPGRPHLRWPKGSKFYFDGTPVPFNHQNEWAYSVLATREPGQPDNTAVEQDAQDILRFFVERITDQGAFPSSGEWDYWWGIARDGWRQEDGISENMPAYPGDKIKAWISFRSIDVMSVLSGSSAFSDIERSKILQSVSTLIAHGKLYPFVGYELARQGEAVRLSPHVARQYARISSPWEIQSAAWAYLYFSRPTLPGHLD